MTAPVRSPVAQETAPGVEVRTELANGFAAEQLIGRSASAALVVLGSRGLGGFSGLVVGSIAVAMATHGHCPVVVVRGDALAGDADGEPVVVGVDGSTASDAAVLFAFEAAASRGVAVVAVHTWSDVALSTGWEVVEWPEIEAEEHALLTERLADGHADLPVAMPGGGRPTPAPVNLPKKTV